jgi:hypothetical protein
MKSGSVALSLVAMLFCARANADPANDLWVKGQYEDAIKQGVAENAPEGLAAAARAAVAEMMAHTPPCSSCIGRAETLSRKALAADPKGVIATLCFNAALGYRSRIVGPFAAHSKGLDVAMKQSLEDALAVHPGDARLIALLGNWDFEAIRAGGSLPARLYFGATMDSGLGKYDEALKLAPNDILINYMYGLGLAAYDPNEYRDKIVAAWKRVVAAPSADAYDDFQKERARELLALFTGNDKSAFDSRLKTYMGIAE